VLIVSLNYSCDCFSITFGQQPYIVQTMPILLFILKVENSFDLYLMGTDKKNELNRFRSLLY